MSILIILIKLNLKKILKLIKFKINNQKLILLVLIIHQMRVLKKYKLKNQ